MTAKTVLVLVFLCVAAAAPIAGGQMDDRESVAMNEQALVDLSTPWLASADWTRVYSFPTDGADEGTHGRVVGAAEERDGVIRVRYDFDLEPMPGAQTLQWVLRLEPEQFDGALRIAKGF